MNYTLDQKQFKLLHNSNNGEVSEDTIFNFSQKDHLITASYSGGSIIYGNIVATPLSANQLKLFYHCMTKEGVVKAGKAIAEITKTKENLLHLQLNWQWLEGNQKEGTSSYLEVV